MPFERVISSRPLTASADEDQSASLDLLRRSAAGDLDGALRIWRPHPALALTRLDTRRPRVAQARELAAAAGLPAVERASGGHAVVIGPAWLCVGVAERAATFAGTSERYRRLGGALVAAFAALGVDAEQGDLPGEWCPGPWSVRSGDVKLAGLAQRVMKDAAWVEAVVALAPDPLARALFPDVYAALELPLDVATLGSVTEAAGAPVAFDDAAAALARAVEDEWRMPALGS